MSARDELVVYAATTRTVTADDLAPFIDALLAEAQAETVRLAGLLGGRDAELERLRGQAAAAGEYYRTTQLQEKEIERLDHLERITLPDLRREIDRHVDGKERWRDRAEKAEAERDNLKARLSDAAMARVWTNEDGKKFVFADDLKGPLLGTSPTEVTS